MQFLLVPLLLVGVVVYLVMHRGHHRVTAPDYVRDLALTLASVFTAIGALFVFGAAFDDPGGWAAVGWIALWVLPLAGLTVLAALRPAIAVWVLGALAAGVLAVAVWYAVDRDAWRVFEDGHGPVRALACFALILPLAMLGRTRTAVAGGLLLAVGVVPIALALGVGGGMAATMFVAGGPAALVGLLDLLAAALDGHRTHDRTATPVAA
jgi:hypothetical protein